MVPQIPGFPPSLNMCSCGPGLEKNTTEEENHSLICQPLIMISLTSHNTPLLWRAAVFFCPLMNNLNIKKGDDPIVVDSQLPVK